MQHNSNAGLIKNNKKIRQILYPLSVLRQFALLPKTVHRQKTTVDNINKNIEEIANRLSEFTESNDTKIHDLNTHMNSVSSRLNAIHNIAPSTPNKAPSDQPLMDDHSLDWFYKLFEDKFRGSEDMIRQRVSEYKPYFDNLDRRLKNLPIIDIGCGRGEFLGFAKSQGLKAVGIDLNYEMIERSKSLGYNAIQSDALEYISNQKDSSIAVVTGFHIVEHIPLNVLIKLFEECYRAIKTGGFVLFETPNPRNIIVGSNTFYIDPSHMKPIPQEFLAFALESVGFKTTIIDSHPARELIQNDNIELEKIMKSFYGPQDYAILAKK